MAEPAVLEYPYIGGLVQGLPESDFNGTDRQTGEPQKVHLEDRIFVSYGRKKATLNGAMVKALHDIYDDESEFRSWCMKCL